MDINKQKRLEIYRGSNEEIQNLYSSPETGRLLLDVEKSLNITDTSEREKFVLAVGDVILGLYKKDSLSQLLKDRLGWTDQQVTLAINTLQELLVHIPDSISKPTDSIVLQPPTQTQSAPTLIDLPTDEQTREAEPEKTDTPQLVQTHGVKSLRTFAEDVEFSRVHGYGSFQSGEVLEDTDDTPVHRSSQDDVLNK